MSPLLWIVAGGTLMSAIALSGSLTLLLPAATLQRVKFPCGRRESPPSWPAGPACPGPGSVPRRRAGWNVS